VCNLPYIERHFSHGFGAMNKQFAVIGNPIEQSRSPELHHAFAQKMGLDLNYSKRLAPLDGFLANIQ
jgi:shikimate dehydrogenase